MKAELEKRESVEDVVKSLVSKPTQEVNTSTEEKPTGLDEGKVKELFQDLMSQNTQKQTENQNLSSVVKALQETHGDKAKDVISARAKELNTDPMQIEALARTNPTMALTLLNVAPSTSTAPAKPTQTSTHQPNHEKLSSVNTEKRLITGGPTREEVMNEWAAIKADDYKNNDIQT